MPVLFTLVFPGISSATRSHLSAEPFGNWISADSSKRCCAWVQNCGSLTAAPDRPTAPEDAELSSWLFWLGWTAPIMRVLSAVFGAGWVRRRTVVLSSVRSRCDRSSGRILTAGESKSLDSVIPCWDGSTVRLWLCFSSFDLFVTYNEQTCYLTKPNLLHNTHHCSVNSDTIQLDQFNLKAPGLWLFLLEVAQACQNQR